MPTLDFMNGLASGAIVATLVCTILFLHFMRVTLRHGRELITESARLLRMRWLLSSLCGLPSGLNTPAL